MSRAQRIAEYQGALRRDVLDRTHPTGAVRPFRHAYAMSNLIIGGADTITLGLGPHPDSHTVAALDENGTVLALVSVPNICDGLLQLHRFALPFVTRLWAVEGAPNRYILPLSTSFSSGAR